MTNVLRELFDEHTTSVMVVSVYDQTVTYANPATRRPGHSLADYTGCTLDRVAAIWELEHPEELPIVQVVAEGHGVFCQRGYAGEWLIASVLGTDPDHPQEALGTVHRVRQESRALIEHELMARRAVAGLELDNAMRLHNAALSALEQSGRHLARMYETLVRGDVDVAPARPMRQRQRASTGA